jgi:hypothetical protein
MFDILCTVMLLWIGLTSLADVVRHGIMRPKPNAVASFESAARDMTTRSRGSE